MRILFVTSEIHPLIKTGGLADVSGSLPAALKALGADVRILVPGYPGVLRRLGNAEEIARLPEGRLLYSTMPDSGVPVMAIDHPPFFWREGNPYLDDRGSDWWDNPARFGLLSRTAAHLASSDSPIDWNPDIVHCNDWQSGLAPAFMKFRGSAAKTVMTIHNIAFQGNFSPEWVEKVGLPAESYTMHGAEFHGHFSFLKAGLFYSDAITTVSPSYAREIQTSAMGCGMEGLLFSRSRDVRGILNGIDLEEWNPAADRHLPAHYDASSLDAKLEVKRELQRSMGLDQEDHAPLFGVVSRLTYQKGLDLVAECAQGLFDQGAQLVVLGSGDHEFERIFLQLSESHPGRCSARIGFDEGLSHRIMAGADIFLMPSRFEPCGLNQMYGMHYGTPPVVRTTGGLADSVSDGATGFSFGAANSHELYLAANRALSAYRQGDSFRKIQQNGMESDFGWGKSAREYLDLYESLTGQ